MVEMRINIMTDFIVINDKNSSILNEIELFTNENKLNIQRILEKNQGIIVQIKTNNGDVFFGFNYEKGWFYKMSGIEIKYKELSEVKNRIILLNEIPEEKILIEYQARLEKIGCEVSRNDGNDGTRVSVYYRQNIHLGHFGYYSQNNNDGFKLRFYITPATSISGKREPVEALKNLEDFISNMESQVNMLNANIAKHRKD